MEYLILLGILKLVDGAFEDAPPEPPPEVAQTLEIKPEIIKKRKRKLAVGGGFNYLNYKQESEDSTIDANFEIYQGPSLFLSFEVPANQSLFFNLQVKSVSGDVDDGTLNLNERKLFWKAITLDTVLLPRSLEKDIFGKNGRTGILLGAQYHTISILDREQVQLFSFNSKNLGLLSLGIYREEKLSSKWMIEYLMRFQPPIKNFLDDDVQVKFSFDGSVGFIRRINEAFWIGFYSYGQYQEYDVKFDDATTSTQPTGTASLLHSNVEARVTYKF